MATSLKNHIDFKDNFFVYFILFWMQYKTYKKNYLCILFVKLIKGSNETYHKITHSMVLNG
jgi:hypothetical protein